MVIIILQAQRVANITHRHTNLLLQQLLTRRLLPQQQQRLQRLTSLPPPPQQQQQLPLTNQPRPLQRISQLTQVVAVMMVVIGLTAK